MKKEQEEKNSKNEGESARNIERFIDQIKKMIKEASEHFIFDIEEQEQGKKDEKKT